MADAAPAATPGAALYAPLAAAAGGGLVFSPVSIAAALRLALPGARGDTAAELAAVAGPAGPQAGLVPEMAATGITLRAPNTVWLQAGYPVDPAYRRAVTALGEDALREADFAAAPEEARWAINTVIAAQTAGKIRDLLAPGTVAAATRLVLASAIYLKAAWEHPFPAGATSDAPFWPRPGQRLTVPMMRLTAQLGYLRGDGYQVVVLPYAGGGLALAVILPDAGPGPVEARLAASGLAGLLAGAAATRVTLALPRFRQTARLGLLPALRTLGVTRAFTREADFTGISGQRPLYLSDVVHQAYLDVNEEGTEAAAATATIMVAAALTRPRPAVEVTVDRPFLFAIVDTGSGLPLFLGRITEPQAG
jgi:serine protease inhibitor